MEELKKGKKRKKDKKSILTTFHPLLLPNLGERQLQCAHRHGAKKTHCFHWVPRPLSIAAAGLGVIIYNKEYYTFYTCQYDRIKFSVVTTKAVRGNEGYMRLAAKSSLPQNMAGPIFFENQIACN